jgi:hypothetical protein
VIKHVFECPSSSPDPLAADCQCSRLRACQESMRAACIAAVEGVDGSQAVLVFREHVLAALQEVKP